jgi:hypothetical protein
MHTCHSRSAAGSSSLERQENAERKKQEQAELEAANLFLFGTPKMPR